MPLIPKLQYFLLSGLIPNLKPKKPKPIFAQKLLTTKKLTSLKSLLKRLVFMLFYVYALKIEVVKWLHLLSVHPSCLYIIYPFIYVYCGIGWWLFCDFGFMRLACANCKCAYNCGLVFFSIVH